MKITRYTPVIDIYNTRRGKMLLDELLPDLERFGDIKSYKQPIIAFAKMLKPSTGLTEEQVDELVAKMNRPYDEIMPELADIPSLDDLDNASYFKDGKIVPGPLDGDAVSCALTSGAKAIANPRKAVSLDGEWGMAFDRDGQPDWTTEMPAPVPGSIHTALVNAGILPDTTFGRNQELGRKYSYMGWWYRKTFTNDGLSGKVQLVFEGVCNRCEVFLNGEKLADHEGMFGGPVLDVSDKLKAENELIVHLFPIPFVSAEPNGENFINNSSWRDTVVVNNVYGWHYSNMPSLGIWHSVRLEVVPQVQLANPFVGTKDIETGEVRFTLDYDAEKAFSGKLSVTVAPENFDGEAMSFELDVAGEGKGSWLTEFTIPNPQLWWPNVLGKQNLYRITAALVADGITSESVTATFGIRTVELVPLSDGPKRDHYNWRFIVNGREAFIRGTGWCTMDAMLDFSFERYDRFLSLAHIQNCQMIRAWGCGLPEKEEFYDLCDRYGIMVMQEWPTAWDSHLQQPWDMLIGTVRRHTLRIRSHASLILYCPGNESNNPYGEAIDEMGRISFELDGTRVFHRGEPFGGSVHNYNSYWGRQPMDVHATLEGDFFGEFGIACTPCLESVNRYLPDDEKNVWPVEKKSAFEYHTPIFGTADDLSRLRQMSGYFANKECDLREVTIASQLSQIVGVRHTLERARIRYPECGGALYYKLNDNFPAMSWATVDWYGAPKLGHYVFQKSFAPAAAFLLVDRLNFAGTARSIPVYVVDDFGSDDASYEVVATVMNGNLETVKTVSMPVSGNLFVPDQVGNIEISYEESLTPPILVHLTLRKNGQKVFDTFYFFNYEAEKGCIFNMPKTKLTVRAEDGFAVIKNEGSVPAVGAMIEQPGHADTFTAQENFMWLKPGEEKRVAVNCTCGLTAWALNA